MKSNNFVLCLIFVVILAIFPAQGMAKTTLVYGTTEKVTDMDPANAYDFHTWEIFYNIYQGLVGYPAGKTNLVPKLAESYDIVDDGKATYSSSSKGSSFRMERPLMPMR